MSEPPHRPRLAELIARRQSPPPADLTPPAGAFREEEKPTRPTNIYTRCAVLVANFKDLTPEEQTWVEDVIAMMLWARDKKT